MNVVMERLKQRFHNSTPAVQDKRGEKEREGLTLHQCLQAVGLQHRYASFTSMGVCRAAHLSALTMEDYPLLGIHTMEDRTRLFHLVQMVKTDLKHLMCEEEEEEEEEEDDDEGCAVVSSRYSCGRDPDEDVYIEDDSSANVNITTADGFARASNVRRRLDFSCETADLHQRLLTSPKGPVHKYTSHNRENNSLYTSHTRLSHQCDSLHKQTPRAATKRFNNKPAGPKHRRRISRPCEERGRSGSSLHNLKPTRVYESARPAAYNYGLPQSSPAAIKRQAVDPRISVCVRKRPVMHAESRRGEADVVTTPGGDCVVIHESKEAVDLTQYILQHTFYFDHVFGEGSSNEDVYRTTAYPLVQHMLSGGEATCFAYGQTGAGKTHTMLGSSPTRPGLYALAVRDIFAHLSTAHTPSPLLVYVSFFEIYCGQLYDLLDQRKRLFAREDGQKVVHIAGLREVQVDSVSSLLELISQGLGERTQGTSGVNPLSSRSHALLQIQLRSEKQQTAGRMWFVDLAGSERASDTKEADRQSRMEGAEINQSLLALKECIRSLDQEQSHTPFRQSKLTQVLKDSFVGNSMTCMIANISPGHLATEHTLNTLRYADRVKELRRPGEVRGGRRQGPKHNSSNGSSSTAGTRGKSPPKKAKLCQIEPPGPTSRRTGLSVGEASVCSTPKTSRWEEETSQLGSKGTGSEHVSPVGGLVGTAGRRERVKTAARQGVREIEHERSDGHIVRCPKGRTEALLGQRSHKGRVSTAQTVKDGTKEERTLTEPQTQVDSSTCREAERQNDRVLKNVEEKDKEKQRHLRWYHQQLQQFTPSPDSSSAPYLSSSNQASLSSSIAPTSCSFVQQRSRLALSALMCHGLAEVLEKYRKQPQTSLHITNDSEDAQGGFDGEDRRLLWEQTEVKFGQRMGESEKSRSVKARREAGAKQENKRTAGIEGGERRQAWVAATESQRSDGMTGVMEDRRRDGEAGLWTTEQGWSGSASAHSHSLLSAFAQQRAPAERPFSPGCEPTDALHFNERRQDTCGATYGNCAIGSETRQTPDAVLVSLQGQGNPQRAPDRVTEDPAPPRSRCAFAFMQASVKQPIKPSAQYTTNTASPSPTHNTSSEPRSSVTTQPPQSVLGHLSVVSSCDPAHSLHVRDNPLKMNSPMEANGQESICSQQVRPTDQRSTVENVNHAQWCVVRAHWEQLEEMEALCHTEGMLLCQQPDMEFREYIHQLEKIMERKARCVHSMRAQLQPYLTPNHSSKLHNQGEYNNNAVL